MGKTVEVDRDLMADLMYESAMYKMYQLENLQLVKDIWNSIDIDQVTEEPAIKKQNSTKSVQLSYDRNDGCSDE